MPHLSYLQRFGQWIIRIHHNDLFMRRIGFTLSIAAILSGIATYLVLTESGNFEDKSGRVLMWIYIDLTLLLLLSVIIAKKLVELWMERRRGSAGSKLHVQIALLFAFVAITPGICVTIFSALFFDVGVKAWFSEPVRQGITESKFVAEAYLKAHAKTVALDGEAIRKQIVPSIFALEELPDILSDKLTQLCNERGLDEALIFNSQRNEIIARSHLTFALEFEKVLDTAFQEAERGEIPTFLGENEDRVRALIRIEEDSDLYLYVGKSIDPDVIQHVVQTRSANAEYQRLDAQRFGLQITFILFFSVVALLLLLASIWAGLTIANLFVRPISRLITAAEEVSKGNLDVRVMSEGSLNNELGNLSQAFNTMISQLSHQRHDLIKASDQIDQRRQFTEAILSRISAGVINIEKNGRISLMNQRAQELLSDKKMNLNDSKQTYQMDYKHQNLNKIAPEIFAILEDFESAGQEVFSRQISLVRRGIVRSLQVVVVLDQSRSQKPGYIITFDDVTPLLVAQRKAAWSDVARKIAHEIKNPLTPIQLAAERLKRKYLKEIQTDPDTFQSCVDTIIRQVGQIGKLVTEFSGFARMPEPVMRPENVVDLLKQALFLQKQAHSTIHFHLDVPPEEVDLNCDASQIGQVLTNLLQNAINAVSLDEFIQRRLQKKGTPEGDDSFVPTISVALEKTQTRCQIIIEDNGPGLPIEGRERLTDPYYTTHEKGTGLGLAIVAKIVEDHRGTLELLDSQMGGAKIIIEFPIGKRESTEKPQQD